MEAGMNLYRPGEKFAYLRRVVQARRRMEALNFRHILNGGGKWRCNRAASH